MFVLFGYFKLFLQINKFSIPVFIFLAIKFFYLSQKERDGFSELSWPVVLNSISSFAYNSLEASIPSLWTDDFETIDLGSCLSIADQV